MDRDPPRQPAAVKTVLLVEDETDLRKELAAALEATGYRVLQSDGVAVAFQLFQAHSPDAVVLDVGLPDGNGVELCEKLRSHKTLGKTPIILLTSRREIEEKAGGFGAGADQYLVKPIAPRELSMWLQAILQRQALDKDEGNELVAGDVAIDRAAHLVRFGDATVTDLTPKEFDLFYALVKHRPKVFSRQYILSKIWRTVAVDGVVNAHISNLRRKLPQRLADRLQTVPGKGFRYFG